MPTNRPRNTAARRGSCRPPISRPANQSRGAASFRVILPLCHPERSEGSALSDEGRSFVAEPVPTLNGASVAMTKTARSARNDIKGGGTPQDDKVTRLRFLGAQFL